MTIEPGQNSSARNRTVAVLCAAFVVGMVGMSYAAVPLYELFCRVTGYGGTTQVATAAPQQVLERTIRISFDANVAAGLGWTLKPETREITLRIGEIGQIAYKAANAGNSATTGTATFNVTPMAAGVYFNKLECFCFTEQQLAANETRNMPVVFFVDPAIVDDPETRDITAITLSYTMFPTREATRPVAAIVGKDDSERRL